MLSSAAALVVGTLMAVTVGWLLDDVMFGHDIPRGVAVAGIDIGNTDRADAAVRITMIDPTTRPIRLEWAGKSLERVASELGVSLDIPATLGQIPGRGSLLGRPWRWLRTFRSDQTIDPILSIDGSRLDSLFTTGDGSAFGVRFGRPRIELVDGSFAAASAATVPEVDIEALQLAIIAATLSTGFDSVTVTVPILGDRVVDNADADLASAANQITADGISVGLVGSLETFVIPQTTLRSWVVFGGTRQDPEIALDPPAVADVIESLFVGIGAPGEQSHFVVDYLGGVHIKGGAPGSVCCRADSAELILDALRNGRHSVLLRPIEDPGSRGVAWAESLGINELVGQFTTHFRAGQTRVTNIDRIAELTQGAIIEPGDTFSINEFVGRRTRDNGFVSAGVISNGVYDSSVGGGISQYATTLFNAAFFAGLDFGEYQSHSIYISRYPYGREATMSFPHPDLQIINNTPYGVLIWPTTTDDSITVSLYSTKWVMGEQTGQTKRTEGTSCTRVTTERTRTWVDDGHTEVDTVTARYRPEGVKCDGSSSVPTSTTTTVEPAPTSTTTTTAAVPTTTTTVTATTTTTTTTTIVPTTTTTTTVPTTTTTHTVPPTTTPAPTTTAS